MARTYNGLGRTLEMKGDHDGAMEHFLHASEAALSVDAQEEQINSLNKQGRVLMHQKSLTRARKCFEQAIELSEKTQDYYQQVESLIDLAEVFEDSGMHDESQQALERGKELALQYRYYSLLGTAEKFQGMVSYEQQDYNSAFNHFVQSCHYMALFNSLRYNEAIRSLIEHLLTNTEGTLDPVLLSMIRTYWSENDLRYHVS